MATWNCKLTGYGNLFSFGINKACTKTEGLVGQFVKNSKLESQGMELAVTWQDKCVATFAEFFFQGRDVMIEKKILQRMRL
jgi:hypothetical protein